MSEQRGSGPTLIVALGDFGHEVVARLRQAGVGGPAPVRRRQVLIALDAGATCAEHVEAIVGRAEGLLGIDAAFQAEPGDESRPTLDLFFVADLAGEDAAALPELVRAAGERLLSRFSNIFPGHDLPNLAICPVVALLGLRAGGRARAAAALEALEEHAKKLGFRSGDASPVARVFVVEQQSARYELKRHELASTVVAFVSLVVGTNLRQQEPLRSFLRSSVEHVRDRRVFASFGCATLELSVERYCVVRAAGELVDGMRAARAAGVGEHAAAAERLVPEAQALAAEICAPEGGDDLVQLLRAHTPHVDFPAIDEHDTPEQVRDVAYGWGWFEALDGAVKALVERLDDREMAEVTRVADERGLAKLRRLVREVGAAIREAELGGPHGWADALRLAEHVRDRADRQIEALSDKLKREAVPPFPEPSAVESAFRALREECNTRPRPYRMRFFGVLGAVAVAALLHHVPKWLYVCVLGGSPSPFAWQPASMSVDIGRLQYLLDPPYVMLWLGTLAIAITTWLMARYRRKRHLQLLAEQDNLRVAVRRYLTDDVGPSVRRYYESRLWLSVDAWVLRVLSRVHELAEREVTRLSKISLALDRLSRELDAEASRTERVAQGDGGDLVYQTALSAELLQQSYEALRPGVDLLDRLFADIEPGDPDEVPPYLLESNLLRLVAAHVTPSAASLAELAGPAVTEFVKQRHGRLGVPLEVRGVDDRTAEQRYLFAPAWAEAPLTELRESLPTLPRPHIHGDPDRVHLVSLQTALTRASIGLPEVAK